MRARLFNLLKISFALAACRTPESTTAPDTATATATATVSVTASATATATDPLQARPYHLIAPDSADAGPLPLVVLLHGYGSNGLNHDTYFGLSALTKKRGVLLAIPDGTRDHKGLLYWNATEACCDFDHAPGAAPKVDDVAYLDAIVKDAEKNARVDPARIYVIGHSNGAFMAHVWACEKGSPLAAIVALAGVPWSDASRCANRDVSVLQVHGDADTVIAFAGGRSFGNGEPYPSAESAVAAWAVRDGCAPTLHGDGPALDLDHAVAGAETTRAKYDCPRGLDVELWRMHGSGHVPKFDSTFAKDALDFLLAHPKIH